MNIETFLNYSASMDSNDNGRTMEQEKKLNSLSLPQYTYTMLTTIPTQRRLIQDTDLTKSSLTSPSTPPLSFSSKMGFLTIESP